MCFVILALCLGAYLKPTSGIEQYVLISFLPHQLYRSHLARHIGYRFGQIKKESVDHCRFFMSLKAARLPTVS